MAKKIILEDSQGNVLHPKTLGECVTTETGETVDGLVSKSQMFSPIIETDSSMSKVGVGTDIDVSLNVKDGAYESLVFKGKSLVNLATQSVNYGLAKHSNITSEKITVNVQASKEIKFTVVQEFSEWIYITVKINLDMLKPNTKYLVVGESIKNINYARICRGDTTHNLEQTPYPYFGNSNCVVLTTNDLTNYVHNDITLYLRPKANLSVGSEVHVKNVMLIEYQEDMENWGIPYFEGLCDSKMPILRNIGKNLFDGNFVYSTYVSGHPVIYDNNRPVTFPYTTSSSNRGVGFVVKVKPNTKYTMSIDNNIENGVFVGAGYSSITDIGRQSRALFYIGNVSNTDVSVRTFTTTNECHYVVIGNYINYNYEVTGGSITFNEPPRIQFEESSTLTVYEPYKTNILRTSEEIVLRSVGDIKDSYNALTGEYVQRIVEYVFNGSESEAWNFAEMKGDNYRFGINLPTFGNKSADKTALICDRLKVGDVAQEPKQEQITTYNHDSYFELRITLSPSTLASNNVDELRRYLQANPITIQYAVAEPITAIIKPSTIPFAYINGHVILESGSSEQSLLPHLKYSVVTGRTGQVTQNAKVLRQQENQITSLEDLLLTQIVQMDYERTLLQFDFELQAMMLG